MSTRLLPIEQATDLVTYKIEIAGEALPATVPVFSIEIMHEINRIPSACLTISDGDSALGEWPVSSDKFFVPGNEIKIFAGYHSEDEEIFSGIVISQNIRVRDKRLELIVQCRDKAISMTTVRKSRHFTDITDADAVAEILAEYEIPDDITSTNTTHADLVQYDTSDWDFVVMRLESNGLSSYLDSKGFHAVKPAVDTTPLATLQFGANIIEFDADIDARRQLGNVTAQAWDFAGQELIVGEAADPAWKIAGNQEAEKLAEVIGASTAVLRHSGGLHPDELQSWSDAALLRSRMSAVRGRARIQGLSTLVPTSVVELSGFGDRFNGLVWLSAVRHEIGFGNWLCDVEFGMPEMWHSQKYQVTAPSANMLLPMVSGLHTGIVTTLEDPAGEARIRVRIPSIDTEGDGVWARVATFDAGNSRGSFFLPEIGDEVIVGFLNDDPRYPVVLGMLHSSTHAPPEKASDNNHVKGYYSRKGMRILFDDEKAKMTIDTPGGQVIVLDDDGKKISLTDRNKNKLEMTSSGITIESSGDLSLKASKNIKIEGQINLELKAGAQWKAEGSAGMEVSSSGITVVKGSLVQIN